MLDKQVSILSVDTGNFYYDDEAALHRENWEVRRERRKRINGYDEKKDDGTKIHHRGTSELLILMERYGFSEKMVNQICRNEEFDAQEYPEISEWLDEYYQLRQEIKYFSDEAKRTKSELLSLLQERTQKNITCNEADKVLRELRMDYLTDENGSYLRKNIISVFDSALTRMIGAEINSLTEDFMVVQVYYFDIIKDLIYNGFIFKGNRYIYFTSSAGQIRTKKAVFIRESVWKEHEKTIMCGLTIDAINQKGGNNPNKHLAYMALTNSATDEWKEFRIDKTIVVPDFETNVCGTYDFVDDTDYSIRRMNGEIPITHTDGAGMILPNAFGKSQRNTMIRLPWVKGLLGVFDFRRFIETYGCSPILKDIYGKEHDVIAEDIQVIFTESQFKLHQYYDSWEQYKTYYLEYGCTAGRTNVEMTRIKNAPINYQMLQSLTDVTDAELRQLAQRSVNRINNMCSSISTVQEIFGATAYNVHKTPFQEAILLYPELLNDRWVRSQLKEIKDNIVMNCRAGKLRIDAKYTFILPDLYAACEFWFLHQDKPRGLLMDGEVYCRLFPAASRLDCLRSPHLYREHAIRNNLAYRENEKAVEIGRWFNTNALYTSSWDLISKILQFDCDGDSSLVVADKILLPIVERNMDGVVPLFYNMRKAEPRQLNNETLYDGLNSAFAGSNIGQYSNSITKIWNSDVFIDGSPEEKQEALDTIKMLCMENNFKIDYAKTLYMPERPPFAKELISLYTKADVPHFFIYAKDKDNSQVEQKNGSMINRLEDVIPNPRIHHRYVELDGHRIKLKKPDCRYMFSSSRNKKRDTFFSKENMDHYQSVIDKYIELNRKYYYKINYAVLDRYSPYVVSLSSIREGLMYDNIITETKEQLSLFGFSESEVVDILVKYLYDTDPLSTYKGLLWLCYGQRLYDNIRVHFGMIREQHIKDQEKLERLESDDAHSKQAALIRMRMEDTDAYEQAKQKKSLYDYELDQQERLYNDVPMCLECGSVLGVDRKTMLCQHCRSVYQRRLNRDAQRRHRKRMQNDL